MKLKYLFYCLAICSLFAFISFQIGGLWHEREMVALKEAKDYSIDSQQRVINVQDRYIADLIFKIENYQLHDTVHFH